MPALTRISTVGLLVILGVAGSAQTLNPGARDILKLSRTLTAAEVQAVLTAAQAALDGVVVHIAYRPDGPGPDMLIRSDGRPRYMRATSGGDVYRSSSSYSSASGSTTTTSTEHVDVTTFTHYTGQVARSCDGKPVTGELVLEYENKGSGWTVKARPRTPVEVFGPIIELLAGSRAVTDGGPRRIGDRPTRGFVTSFKLPEGATGGPPEGTTETIFIDTETLRPARWIITLPEEARRELPSGFEYGVSFTYPEGVTLQPPEGVAVPDCVR